MASELWRRTPGSYRGLVMRCAPGTHEAAMEVIREAGVTSGAVLDLASGSGAMLARLRDGGFGDLTAVELDAKKFGLEGVEPRAVDLNGDFAAELMGALGRKFSLITAIEIIEHLDSPRHFLGQARELLEEDGTLLLTTPNIAEWMGRLKFLLTGTLRYFDEGQYRYNHHVSPLPEVQLRNLVAEVGLKVVGSRTAGNFNGVVKMACLAPVWVPFRVLGGKRAMGDVNVYAMRRGEARSSRAEDWSC